jgi:hypothetical protein
MRFLLLNDRFASFTSEEYAGGAAKVFGKLWRFDADLMGTCASIREGRHEGGR